jgi:hypothetical protein
MMDLRQLRAGGYISCTLAPPPGDLPALPQRFPDCLGLMITPGATRHHWI